MPLNQRIVVATGLYPPDVGGPATYTVFLEEHLPQHGIQPVVVPFGRVRGWPKIIRHIVYTFLLIRASKGASIIYALDPVSVGVPARIAALLTRKTFLIRVAGDYAWEQGTLRYGIYETLDEYLVSKRAPLPVRILAFIEARTTRAARHVIVPSVYLKSVVEKWGVPSSSITVVYNAFDSDSLPAARSLRADESPVIMSAGRLVPWKGFAPLIEMMLAIRSVVPGSRLMIAGDGPDRAVIEQVIKEERFSGCVHMLGSLTRDTLHARLAAADLFVLNTAYEGLSHQLLEAMALGVPVVTTNVGGNPELIKDGENGMLVPWGDAEALRKAIITMLTDPERRRKYADAARVTSASFTEERAVADFLKVLDVVTS